ncbi:TetR/AcrR family transcriptional regulator [Streptomyces sp. NPDC090025]|uniref:TetR/AcrR family transcriptional regulator n=1 Tax=Streptomyces sp. NPDC090025 TaxID=3365922 RepID=UPI003834DC92
MPTARETLLDTARTALDTLPWSAVRMVDVAARARVSRQTLYNEFGSKEGLARALVRREADHYLRGVEAALARPGPPAHRLAAAAEWTVAAAAARPLTRALLTGTWDDRLPAPRAARRGGRAPVVPEQRRADAGVPTPAELLAQATDRAAALAEHGAAPDACELALRLALSYVVTAAPAAPAGVPRHRPAPGQWAEPDSCRPMTPTITRLIETILSVDTTSPRKIIP